MKQSIYQEVVERDEGFCQDCDYKAAGEIHHIVRRGYWGKNAKYRGEVVENLISLCWKHHQGAHTKEAQRRHLTLLREKWGYLYDSFPWKGILGEAWEDDEKRGTSAVR